MLLAMVGEGTDSGQERMVELFKEFQRTQDPRIRERLILLHKNLVYSLSKRFANRGEPLEDLIQVGMIGLINAIDRFDPERGIRFATYATPTIVGEIKRYFRDRGWAIKVPRRLQEISLEVSKAVERLGQRLDRSPTVQEIAGEIGVSEEDALEAIEMGQFYELVSLDGELGSDDDGSRSVLADYVGEQDGGLESLGTRSRLDDAIGRLPAREQDIVRLRFFKGLSQTETAKQLGISQMHVSRLQRKALDRLREVLQEPD